jgi:rhamnose transport system ATP-binding protein
VVYQHPALFPDLTVTENLALAIGHAAAWRTIDWSAWRRRAVEWLTRAGANIDPDRLAGSLSMPEQQLVELAKAIGADARVILLDEPTASLTDHEVTRLFAVLASLRAQGAGIVYISHRLDEVLALADRITVLRDGQTVASLPTRDVDHASLVRMMAGRDAPDAAAARGVRSGPVALALRGMTSRQAGIADVTLSVHRGEILGLSGLVGSGRTELAEVLFGLRSFDTGGLTIGDQQVVIRSPADAIRHGLAYVPEDRQRHGVIAGMTIASNVSLAVLRDVTSRGFLDEPAERALADGFVNRLQIKTPSVDTSVATLSGGNQQKVAVARWLATNPAVLILDEPTQGVDVAAKAELHALMHSLAAGGLAIIMISSDLTEILAMSDRIAVMCHGRVAGILSGSDATAASVLALAFGVSPPAAAEAHEC